MSKQEKKQKIKRLKFPITARQAQKLLKNGDRKVCDQWGDNTTVEQLLNAPVLALFNNLLESSVEEKRKFDLRLDKLAKKQKSSGVIIGLKSKLAKIASANPNQIVISDISEDDYEDYDCDESDFLDYDEEDEADNLDPQYAPKGTDEVAPQSDSPSDDAEMHGGDNASQEVEDGQSQGGKQSSSNQAQSQNAGTDEGENGQGSGSGLQTNKSQEDGDAEQSDRPETGSATSGDAANSANPQTPSHQKAGTSEAEAVSELGEGTATSPVSEPDGKTMPAIESDRSRDSEEDAESQKSSDFGESQGRDNFNPEGQAKSFEDVDEANQGQSGDLEDNQNNSLADDESDWGDSNSEVNQVSDDIPQHQKKWGKSFSKQEQQGGKLSASANSNHGGVNSSLVKAGISPKLAKECQRKLAKLIGDATTETSPRRDYQGFCERIKTFRNPNPARKEESGRPVILIMADVSGSCSSFSDQSVMVAKAASKLGVQGSDVIVLTHSNGYPCELEHNGKAIAVSDIAIRSRRGEHAHENAIWYDALMQKYQVAVAIALGDWDAADDYSRIMEHPNCERFIWLDNAFCSSRGFVKNETKSALQGLSRYTKKISQIRHKLTYKTGCKDAKAFVKEIE